MGLASKLKTAPPTYSPPDGASYASGPPPAYTGGGMVTAAYNTRPRYSGPYRGDLITNLRRIVNDNNLHAWYNDATLRQMADRMAQRMGSNASTIEASFGMPGLANDIQTLDDAAVFSIVGLYDVVIYIDDSGSMEYYNQHDGRKDDLMSLLEIICKIVTIYDEDGVSLRFFNSTVSKDNVRTAQDIISTIRQVQFDGLTPLGTNLDKRIIQPLIIGPARAGRLPKPVLTIVLTDGEPNGEEGGNNRKVFDVIGACRKALAATQYGVGAAEFQFVQLGKDLAAQKFLGQLDSDPVIGDLVDVTSNYEMEAEEWRQKGNDLDVGVYIHKLLTGSIDPNMDAADE